METIVNINFKKIIKPNKLWVLVKEFTDCIDLEFSEHGERCAFIMLRLLDKQKVSKKEKLRLLFSTFFHDIGAYTSNELPNLLLFDPYNTLEHSVRGYLFLKNYSPLQDNAKMVLYHHAYYDKRKNVTKDIGIFLSGVKIHLVDRIDVLNSWGISKEEIINKLQENTGKMFNPKDVTKIVECINDTDILEKLNNTSYKEELDEYFNNVTYNEQMITGLILMLSNLFELYNYTTLGHSKMTAELAYLIGKQFHLNSLQLKELYLSGLVHDYGKVKIPLEIIDKKGQLTNKEMNIMKKHVVYTYELLKDYLPIEIVEISSNHHERIDGSGYPNGLKKDEMNISSRVLQVADVISALYGKRSYKEKFSVSLINDILNNQMMDNKLDSDVILKFLKYENNILKVIDKSLKNAQMQHQSFLIEYNDLIKRNTWCR